MFATALKAFLDATGIIASSQSQERALALLREDTGAIYHLYPEAASYDVSVPLSRVSDYVARILPGLATVDPLLCSFVFGHLADGNLHIVLNRAGALDSATATKVEAVLYGGLSH